VSLLAPLLYTLGELAIMNRQLKRDTKVVCLADLEREGSRNLSKMIGEYYNEGAMDLITYVAFHSRGGGLSLTLSTDSTTTRPPLIATAFGLASAATCPKWIPRPMYGVPR
jgi:hypothetical protein